MLGVYLAAVRASARTLQHPVGRKRANRRGSRRNPVSSSALPLLEENHDRSAIPSPGPHRVGGRAFGLRRFGRGRAPYLSTLEPRFDADAGVGGDHRAWRGNRSPSTKSSSYCGSPGSLASRREPVSTAAGRKCQGRRRSVANSVRVRSCSTCRSTTGCSRPSRPPFAKDPRGPISDPPPHRPERGLGFPGRPSGPSSTAGRGARARRCARRERGTRPYGRRGPASDVSGRCACRRRAARTRFAPRQYATSESGTPQLASAPAREQDQRVWRTGAVPPDPPSPPEAPTATLQ